MIYGFYSPALTTIPYHDSFLINEVCQEIRLSLCQWGDQLPTLGFARKALTVELPDHSSGFLCKGLSHNRDIKDREGRKMPKFLEKKKTNSCSTSKLLKGDLSSPALASLLEEVD